MSHTLFVIEAPGKSDKLREILSQTKGLGDFEVVATRGHFCRMPSELDPLYIDDNLRETARHADEVTKKLLLDGCDGAKEVVIATDSDAEGEVIARDVFSIVSGVAPVISRMKFLAIARDSIVEAYHSRKPFDEKPAYSGDARRVFDRLMGAALCDREKKIYSGRVQAALLNFVGKREPVAGEAVVALRASDGGRDFIAKVPYTKSQEDVVMRLVESASKMEPVDVASRVSTVTSRPWGFGDAVVKAHVATGMPVSRVSEVMQGLYESGKMTYPRSSARAIHESTVSSLERIAKEHRVKFDASRVPTLYGNGVDGVSVSHPSPAPLVGVDLNAPLRTLSPEDRVLSVITRNLMESGISRVVEVADLTGCEGLPQSLSFSRVDRPLSWERAVTPGLVKYDPQASMILLMQSAGIGRPSTLVSHADKFVERGLLGEDMRLSEKGRQWLDSLPKAFGKISPALLEFAFDLLPGTPQERLRTIVAMIGDAGSEVIRRFEEITKGEFPNLPDRADVQLRSQRLQESIRERRAIEAGVIGGKPTAVSPEPSFTPVLTPLTASR
mgnify:CR=1 FL=1